MFVIICGSRRHLDGSTVADLSLIEDAVQASQYEVTCVVSGAARGADALGAAWAEDRGLPVVEFPVLQSDIERHGFTQAARLRNARMGRLAQQEEGACLALWNGLSGGTKNMIDVSRRLRLPTHIYRID